MGYLGPSLRRKKRKERPGRRAAIALLASLALNGVLLWAVAVAGAFRLHSGRNEPTRVALAHIGAAQWDANRAVAPSAPKATPPPEERPTGRVVELSPEQKASDKPPPDARFLSDRNTRVEKQTVSRYAGIYPRLAPRPEPGANAPAPTPAQPKPAPPPRGGTAGDEAAKAGEATPRERKTGEGKSEERVASIRPEGDLRLRDLGERGEAGRRRGEGGRADLSLTPEALHRIAGGPSMDGVGEGLEEGESTWLQSREFKYATFMNRMRNEIGRQWYPRVRDAQHQRDPDGSLFFYRERTVVLGLTMDTQGNVRDLSVLESSNVDFFDRVAVASVQAAQPFPNPPQGMFHSEPEVRIPFSFTMYPGSGRAALFWRAPAP